MNPVPCRDVPRRVRERVTLRGWLAASRRVRTSRGEWMRFLTLEDETDLAEVVVFPDVYRRDGAPPGRARHPVRQRGRSRTSSGPARCTRSASGEIRSQDQTHQIPRNWDPASSTNRPEASSGGVPIPRNLVRLVLTPYLTRSAARSSGSARRWARRASSTRAGGLGGVEVDDQLSRPCARRRSGRRASAGRATPARRARRGSRPRATAPCLRRSRNPRRGHQLGLEAAFGEQAAHRAQLVDRALGQDRALAFHRVSSPCVSLDAVVAQADVLAAHLAQALGGLLQADVVGLGDHALDRAAQVLAISMLEVTG